MRRLKGGRSGSTGSNSWGKAQHGYLNFITVTVMNVWLGQWDVESSLPFFSGSRDLFGRHDFADVRHPRHRGYELMR